MAKINFVGVDVAPNAEAEIKINDSKGLNAKVEFVDGNTEIFNNLTEIHWRYKSGLPGDRVALESSIHGTGFTYCVNSIKSIHIDTASKVLCPI